MGRALVPDISITDPRLLMTMPEWLNAATGLDALTHGIEAFVSLAHNPLADIHALQRRRRWSARNLRTTITAPREEAARSKMAQASLNAGLAFTNAILGATHAMSHQVGGLLDAPHGVVNGVLLPHVIRYNAQESPERFVDLARSAGLQVDGVPGERGGRDARRARARAGRRRRRAPGPARARRRRERDPAARAEHPRRRLPDDQPALGVRPATWRSCSWRPSDAGVDSGEPAPAAARPGHPHRGPVRQDLLLPRLRPLRRADAARGARDGLDLPRAGPHRRGPPRAARGGGPGGGRAPERRVDRAGAGRRPPAAAPGPGSWPPTATARSPSTRTTCRPRCSSSCSRSAPATPAR